MSVCVCVCLYVCVCVGVHDVENTRIYVTIYMCTIFRYDYQDSS